MNRKDFYYNLPEELIAQHPMVPRDASRMLVYDRQSDRIEDKIFRDITDFFEAGDLLVINNTKVIPARLMGIKKYTGAKIEMLLIRRINLTDWIVLSRPAKRLAVGNSVTFSDQLSAKIIDAGSEGIKTVRFIFDGVFEDILDRLGEMPLPHYIREMPDDKGKYQTVYAKNDGSCAAPTAGLHFTEPLMQKIRDMGVEFCEVLLHVGLGTFRPVKVDDIKQHKMHSEYFEISEESAAKINRALKEGRRVIAVGTTSVRVLESAARGDCIIKQTIKEAATDKLSDKTESRSTDKPTTETESNDTIRAGSGFTDIFIYPPYEFKVVNALLTNFHLPESTLIMLVSAFIGREKTLQLYNHAVQNKYRFFSFGDCMLLK